MSELTGLANEDQITEKCVRCGEIFMYPKIVKQHYCGEIFMYSETVKQCYCEGCLYYYVELYRDVEESAGRIWTEECTEE